MKSLSDAQRAAVAELRRRLEAAGLPVVRLALFGSYARGEVHEESDIDILVFVRDDGRRWLLPAIDVAAHLESETGIPLSVKVFTEEGFAAAAADPLSFAHAVAPDLVPLG